MSISLSDAESYTGQEPLAELCNPDTGFDGAATICTARWLSTFCEYHTLNDDMWEWYEEHMDDVETSSNSDDTWFNTGRMFMESIGYTCVARENTYNNENDFSHGFLYEVWEPENEQSGDWIYSKVAVVLLYIHRGFDPRSGYSRPLIVTFEKSDCEYSMILNWVCGYYLYDPKGAWDDDWKDSVNDKLTIGYSNYPYRQIEEMGFKWVETNDDYYEFEMDGGTFYFRPYYYV